MKTVKVLDIGTKMYFLIGRPEPSDLDMLESTGWGVQPVTLIINIKGGGGIEGCMSTFRGYVENDLQEYGPLSVSGTTVKLAKIVRDMELDNIPDVLDVRKY